MTVSDIDEQAWAATLQSPGANGAGGHAPAINLEPDDPAAAAAEQARLAEREEADLADRQRRFKRVQRKVDQEMAVEAETEQAQKRRLRLTPGSAFRIKPVRWVWADRMPVGEITLIPGREGAGKSTFLAWQAAAITRGELPGMFHGVPKGVLYAATEDSWEYTIAPRMIAAGADMGRVFRIDVEHAEVDGLARHGKLSLPVDTRLIPEAAAEVDAACLMCDPVISIIDDKINTFKAQELRSALEPLKRAVEEAQIALAGLVHFNKTKDTDVLSMISGSRAWPEVARAVIAIAVDKDAEQYTCVVSQVKNNLGRSDLPHLTYTIRTHVITAADHEVADVDVEIGRLLWTGETDRGVEDILSTSKDSAPATGDATQAVVSYVAQRFRASGQRVGTKELTDKFTPGEMSAANLKKILERSCDRGTLRRPVRGFYEPGDVVLRTCPGCGRELPEGQNFCRKCAQDLDGSAGREASDGLF